MSVSSENPKRLVNEIPKELVQVKSIISKKGNGQHEKDMPEAEKKPKKRQAQVQILIGFYILCIDLQFIDFSKINKSIVDEH